MFIFNIPFTLLAEVGNETPSNAYIDCDQIIPDRHENYRKIILERKSSNLAEGQDSSDRILPEDYPICNIKLENVCGQYDTGKRCVKAPCPGVFIYIDYKTSCEACRDLRVYGIYNIKCSEIKKSLSTE